MPRKNDGSVKQGKDGLWYARVRWTDENNYKPRDKKFPPASSQADAWKLIFDFKKKLKTDGTKAVDNEKLTFANFAAEFEKKYLVKAEKRNGKKIMGLHLRGMNARMNALVAYFGRKQLRQIKCSDIGKFKEIRLDKIRFLLFHLKALNSRAMQAKA